MDFCVGIFLFTLVQFPLIALRSHAPKYLRSWQKFYSTVVRLKIVIWVSMSVPTLWCNYSCNFNHMVFSRKQRNYILFHIITLVQKYYRRKYPCVHWLWYADVLKMAFFEYILGKTTFLSSSPKKSKKSMDTTPIWNQFCIPWASTYNLLWVAGLNECL